MNHRVLDFSSRPYRLHTQYKQLVIEPENAPRQTVPLEDIAVVLVAHRQVSFTQAVMEELAENGGILVICDKKSLPVGIFSPLFNHSLPCKRLKEQISASEPLIKKAWKQIVQAKVRNQGLLLKKLYGKDFGLFALSKIVKSGDPHNVEARAAKRYWKKLFSPSTIGAGEIPFHRKPDGGDLRNLMLNYGYGVLRAIIARASVAVGFHPSIGLHHHNQYNGYCLADDLMEPFRPVVDEAVYHLVQAPTVRTDTGLIPEVKAALLEPLLGRFNVEGEHETLFDAALQLAQSLVNFFAKERKNLRLPNSCEVYEEKPF
jgi:CRISPR-associated protein Cas1